MLDRVEILERHDNGCRAFGEMMIGIIKSTKKRVLIKRLKLPPNKNHFESKGKVRVYHSSIVTYFHCFEDEQYQCCIFEHYGEGDLFLKLQNQMFLNLRMSQKYFCQIVNALAAFHSKGIAHRHLSLETVFILKNDFCQLIDVDDLEIKSPYQAPEASLESYDPVPADIWSLGVILYRMLTGFVLVENATENDARFVLLKTYGIAALADHDDVFLPQLVLVLLNGMLQITPETRWSIAQIIRHKFLTIGRLSDKQQQLLPKIKMPRRSSTKIDRAIRSFRNAVAARQPTVQRRFTLQPIQPRNESRATMQRSRRSRNVVG